MHTVNAKQVAVFRERFRGRDDVYGTWFPETHQARTIKCPVTDAVISTHLCGSQPLGIFLLTGNRTRSLVFDFDTPELESALDCIATLNHYGLTGYIERSKSKGHHVWVFFDDPNGVLAIKARAVAKLVLSEINQPKTEIFPKQDQLNGRFGNFIFLPLAHNHVQRGRTVFLDPRDPSRIAADQWDLLDNAARVTEAQLDDIINVNDLHPTANQSNSARAPLTKHHHRELMPCTKRMLAEGVTENQRVSCFRLAIHLKQAGYTAEETLPILQAWAPRNCPTDGKRIITPEEVCDQTNDAFTNRYRTLGCEDPAVEPYCDPTCPLHRTSITTSRSTPMAEKSTQNSPPIQVFRSHGKRVCIWENITERDGVLRQTLTTTIDLTRYERETGEYVETKNLFTQDVAQLAGLLQAAFSFMVQREAQWRAEQRAKEKADDNSN